MAGELCPGETSAHLVHFHDNPAVPVLCCTHVCVCVCVALYTVDLRHTDTLHTLQQLSRGRDRPLLNPPP